MQGPRLWKLVVELPHIEDAGALLADRAFGGRYDLALIAADDHRAAAADAREAAGAAGELEIAVTADHIDALAVDLRIDVAAVLSRDQAAARACLPPVLQADRERGRALHQTGCDGPLVRLGIDGA